MREFFWLLAAWMLTVPLGMFVYLAITKEIPSKEVPGLVAAVSTGYLFGIVAWHLVQRTDDA